MLRHLANALLTALLAAPAIAQPDTADLPGQLTRDWADDRVWYDGLAEIATYDATRRIYGAERSYTAQLFTNKERLSMSTFTKAAGGAEEAIEVFKFHARDEDIPAGKYDYNFSTMAYVATGALTPVKLEMGSQEDCGATFKSMLLVDGELDVLQSSYFPNEGMRLETMTRGVPTLWLDALPLQLRGYPFEDPLEPTRVAVLPEQTTTKWSPFGADVYELRYAGRETLDLPMGEVAAHKLVLRFVGPTRERRHDITLHFHADPATQHVMVAYDDPGLGQAYRLRSVERAAYWR